MELHILAQRRERRAQHCSVIYDMLEMAIWSFPPLPLYITLRVFHGFRGIPRLGAASIFHGGRSGKPAGGLGHVGGQQATINLTGA